MEHGYLILSLVALLFISMYGYSYMSVSREMLKQKRKEKTELAKEERRRQERIKNQEIRDEKLREFNERKEEIQRELALLEKMKQKQKVS